MTDHPLHHVGVAVPSLEGAVRVFERLTGASSSPPERVAGQGVRVAFVGPVELLEPEGVETPVGRFLERRGAGLHHVAFRVPELEEALAGLAADGFELVDREPRTGARGHRVAFVHPRSAAGVLVELVEDPG